VPGAPAPGPRGAARRPARCTSPSPGAGSPYSGGVQIPTHPAWSRARLPGRLGAGLLAVALLTACSSGGSGQAGGTTSPSARATTATASPSAPAGGYRVVRDGPAPEVTGGGPGQSPHIAAGQGRPGDAVVINTLRAGDGRTARQGDLVVADFVVQKWAQTRPMASTYEAHQPVSFQLAAGQTIPAWQELAGVRVGARMQLVVPPRAGFGTKGNTQAGISGTDTLVYVFDIRGAYPPRAAADGTPVPPPAGSARRLPTVTVKAGTPQVSVPSGVKPPTSLTKVALLTGDGARVRTGQTVVVQYTGALWADGSTFDSSWRRGVPAAFPIGRGMVIPGWDAGLVGARVGDRLLLVLPPDQGYGKTGAPQAGIPGGATLVFVVDLLDAI